MSETGPLETVYDAEISPLVAQIIAICKRANLPVYASFRLDGDMVCTTFIPPLIGDVAEDDLDGHETWMHRHEGAANDARQEASGASPLMITTRNAAGQVIQMTAVL